MKRLGMAMLIVLAAGGALRADEAAEMRRLREENARLKARVAELEKQLGIVQQQKQELAAQKQQLAEAKQAIEAEREQAAAEQRDFYIAREVDDKTGRTELTTRVSAMVNDNRGQLRRHWMNLVARRPDGAVPDHVDLVIQTYATGRGYRSVDNIPFTVGETTFEAPVVEYDSKMRLSGSPRNRIRNDDEYLTIRLTLDQLKRIAEAHGSTDVTGRLGHQGFALTREQINMFRAMADELGVK